MLFVTGSYQPSSFTVVFVDIDSTGNDGHVAAHTCPKELHLPRGIFEDEEAYCHMCSALMAAMDHTYNTI